MVAQRHANPPAGAHPDVAAGQDGDGNAPSYRQRTGGVLAGGDIRVGDGWRVGVALGYQDSTI
ncbi:autotransporter outer membrane beta-barrel domain-containing protein, partial [Paenibacillus polymyxa]|nr:autotransporter outer membrane beta-barrel domain-containing protein [Paenibacillus polymyxa]